MEHIEFRQAKPEDAREIVAVNEASWLSAYISHERGITAELLHARFADGKEQRIRNIAAGIMEGRYFMLGILGGNIAGYVAPKFSEGKHRVGAIYIRPDMQGKGLGSSLIQEVFACFKGQDIYLDVVEYNHNARAFYESKGFEYTGEKSTFPINNTTKSLPLLEMVKRF